MLYFVDSGNTNTDLVNNEIQQDALFVDSGNTNTGLVNNGIQQDALFC